MLGETPGLLLVPQRFAVDPDGELAGVAGDQVRFDAVLSFDRSRETRGFGLVVSNHAVADLDVHLAIAFRLSISEALGTMIISQRRFD